MANAYDFPGAEPDQSGGPPGGPGGPPGAPPDAGNDNAPPQRGPILAALQRQQQGPQPSAPGQGNQADGLMKVKSAIDLLQQALPGLPAGENSHRDVLNALRQLSRHLPQGGPTIGVQQTQLGDLLRATIRNALLQKIMGQGGGQGGPGEGGGQQPPMPSTPLPGA